MDLTKQEMNTLTDEEAAWVAEEQRRRAKIARFGFDQPPTAEELLLKATAERDALAATLGRVREYINSDPSLDLSAGSPGRLILDLLDSAPPVAKTPMTHEHRDALKHLLEDGVVGDEGDTLRYIPKGVCGMYADAILDRFAPPVARPLPDREALADAIELALDPVEFELVRYGTLGSLAYRAADAVLAAIETAPVVSDDTEWEYCIAYPDRGKLETDSLDPFDTLEDARAELETGHYLESDRVVRRRKAGPWVAIEKGGE